MAVKIRSTKDVHSDGVKSIVYGKSGIGKTTLLATVPRTIIMSCESGLLSLKKLDVPYIRIKTLDDLWEAHEYVTGRRGRKYAHIGLDSISEMAEVALSDLKKANKNVQKAYGEMADEMEKVIRAFRDIKGKHVTFSAKRGRVSDPDTGLTQYMPKMPGKILPEGLSYYFDEVFYMTKIEVGDEGKTQRALITEPGLEYEAKDRSGELDEYERPNLRRIFRKIAGN